jgi:N-hydroxyarylamine O-acetyltransferase
MFNLEPQFPSDYELANQYTSTSPNVPFVSTLIVERLAGERLIGSADEFGRVLDNTFHIRPPAPVAEIFARFGG